MKFFESHQKDKRNDQCGNVKFQLKTQKWVINKTKEVMSWNIFWFFSINIIFIFFSGQVKSVMCKINYEGQLLIRLTWMFRANKGFRVSILKYWQRIFILKYSIKVAFTLWQLYFLWRNCQLRKNLTACYIWRR